MVNLLADLVCPRCGSPLVEGTRDGLVCSACATAFGCDDGLPLLFWPEEDPAGDDVTELVRAFYEETPFPDYDDLDSSASLKEKARRGLFARLLDEQIPAGARVLDAGCGTGQLTSFLALDPSRTVVGADVCLNSLRLARAFQRRNRIENAAFVQMNLFRPVFPPASFHLVISNGVLHHTGAPRRGFERLARLVRPGGFFVLGLYNAFGRLATDLRRLLFRLTGERASFLDPRLRAASVGAGKKHSWFMDQYRHPHESKHTMGEVLEWFAGSGFDFVNAVPGPRPFAAFSRDEALFRARPAGSALDRFLVQAGMTLRGGEGGLFVMIGRRRTPP